MICEKCGAEMADNEKFCKNCGTPNSAFNDSQVTVEGAVAGTPGKKKLGVIAVAVAAVIVVVLVINGISGAVKSKPLPSLFGGMSTFIEDVKGMKNGHIEFSVDGASGEFDFELNTKKKEAMVYGKITNSYYGESYKMALYINKDNGTMAVKDGSEVYTNPIDDEIIEEIWKATEEDKLKNIDVKGYIEDMGVESEVEDYINLDEINKAYKKVIKSLDSRADQKKLEEELDIEKSKKSGENVYTLELDGKNAAGALEVLAEIVEEDAEDAIVGKWFDNATDDIEYIERYGNLAEIEWRTKKNKFTKIEFSADEVRFNADMEYKMGKLRELELNINVDGDIFKVSIEDIGKVKNVEKSIPDKLLEEIK